MSEQFVSPAHRSVLAVASDPGRLLDQLAAAPAPPPAKWSEPDEIALERV